MSDIDTSAAAEVAERTREFKQVIVVNEALALPRGKLAAQVAHASVAALLQTDVTTQREWLRVGMPKVVVQCDCDARLLELESAAVAAGLPCALIRDAGRTVIAAGTATCLGIGPAPPRAIDQITGQLRLVR